VGRVRRGGRGFVKAEGPPPWGGRQAGRGQGGGADSNGGVMRVLHAQTGMGMGDIADGLQIQRDHTLVGKKDEGKTRACSWIKKYTL